MLLSRHIPCKPTHSTALGNGKGPGHERSSKLAPQSLGAEPGGVHACCVSRPVPLSVVVDNASHGPAVSPAPEPQQDADDAFRQLTSWLSNAETVVEIRARVKKHWDKLSLIHVATAIVRLSKLLDAAHEGPFSATARQQPGASSSSSSTWLDPPGSRHGRKNSERATQGRAPTTIISGNGASMDSSNSGSKGSSSGSRDSSNSGASSSSSSSTWLDPPDSTHGRQHTEHAAQGRAPTSSISGNSVSKDRSNNASKGRSSGSKDSSSSASKDSSNSDASSSSTWLDPPGSAHGQQHTEHAAQGRAPTSSISGNSVNKDSSNDASKGSKDSLDNRPGGQHSEAEQLTSDLGERFMAFVGIGAFEESQLLSVFGALAKLQYCPAEGTVSSIISSWIGEQGQPLHEGSARVLGNLAVGLSKLGYPHSNIWHATTAVSSVGLHACSSQELGNLAWAAANASADSYGSRVNFPRQQAQDQLRALTPLSSRLAFPQGHAYHTGPQKQQSSLVSPHFILLSRIAEHVTAHRQLTTFKTYDIVILLWACAKLGYYNGSLMDSAATQLLNLMELPSTQLPPAAQGESLAVSSLDCENDVMAESFSQRPLLDLASAAWAFAKLNHYHPRLMDAIACTALQLPMLKQGTKGHSQELCNLLWAMATLQRPHARLCGALTSALHEQAAAGLLVPQTIANATWAVARLGGQCPCPPAFTATMLSAALPQICDFKTEELANLMWAVAAMGHPLKDTDLESFVSAVRSNVHNMEPAALAQVVWAGGPLTHLSGRTGSPPYADSSNVLGNEEDRWNSQGRELAKLARVAALPLMHQFRPQELAVLARCLTEQHEANREIFKAIEEASLRQISQFTPEGLSNLLWAFAHSRKNPTELIAAAVNVAISRLHHFTLLELSTLLWALAAMQYQDKELLNIASQVIVHRRWAVLQAGLTTGEASLAVRASRAGVVDGNSKLQSQYQRPAMNLFSANNLAMGGNKASRAAGPWPDSMASSVGQHEHSLEDGSAASVRGIDGSSSDGGGSGGGADANRGFLKDMGRRQAASRPNYGIGIAWATLAQAFGSSGYHQSELYDCIAIGVLPYLPTLDNYCLSRLLWSFAMHHHRHAGLLEAAAAIITQRLEACNDADSGVALYSSTRGDAGSSSTTQQASGDTDFVGRQSVNSSRSTLSVESDKYSSSSSINSSSSSSGSFGHSSSGQRVAKPPRDVCVNTDPFAIYKLSYFRPTGLSLVVASYAKLRHESVDLFNAVFTWAMRNQETFDLETWTRLTWSYSTMCHSAEGKLFQRLSQLQRGEWIRNSTRGFEGRHSQQDLRQQEQLQREQREQQEQRQQDTLFGEDDDDDDDERAAGTAYEELQPRQAARREQRQRHSSGSSGWQQWQEDVPRRVVRQLPRKQLELQQQEQEQEQRQASQRQQLHSEASIEPSFSEEGPMQQRQQVQGETQPMKQHASLQQQDQRPRRQPLKANLLDGQDSAGIASLNGSSVDDLTPELHETLF